ncbi:hypothetical protein [Tenacibaculum jejuense]|uniref:Outer membrane protein beta-barrel domain-containing protein n=1 Tax=Tenacibaculum jejuense TaxID=584609 RepID=A0A238UA75_9FLAO|nr:hypothetical protein [Tenacibaculum jejuense]SNR16081.1 conserved exported protein of unknown function [Tenacibaculum jejuense]
MKRILLILVLLCTTYVQSQDKTFEKEVKKISLEIEKITKQEKDSLKKKVKAINKRLSKGEITEEKAKQLKKEVAELHASNIENRVGKEELKLQQLVQDKTNGKIASDEAYFNDYMFNFQILDRGIGILDPSAGERRRKRNRKRNKRTTSQIVLAMGLSNVIENHNIGSINDSEYKFWQSHFYEIGFSLKTRLSKKASKTYFKYGLSFLWNNLRADNNQVHEVNGNQTNLVTFPQRLTESRLRHVQMNFPMHLEFDFSKNKKYDDGFVKDRTNKGIRLGVGGFFGFKLGTRQYLEYENSNGIEIEEVQKDPFNMNTLNYGLSGYLSYKWYGLYVKYDLNPLFKNSNTRNLSLGVRLDLN